MSDFKSRIRLHGKLGHKAPSVCLLLGVAIGVALRRAIGRPLVAEWPYDFELANLFFRAQMEHAFTLAKTDIGEARAYCDSLELTTDETFPVEMTPSKPGEPLGAWFVPREANGATMLYFHGGGYAFYPAFHFHFASLLAASTGARVFAARYRLTPEHPHPAQIEDAIAAYNYVLDEGVDPQKLVIAGDSAGGHLTLMTLLALRDAGLPQPALAIGICPWTDIGSRGSSFYANNRYDIVQRYEALQYGAWLKGNSGCADEELSPIHYNYHGLAPLYLQGGGKEILIDMIRDFAETVRSQGASVMLDVWETMTHVFQGYGSAMPESREALERMRAVVESVVSETGRQEIGRRAGFSPCARTETHAWAEAQRFRPPPKLNGSVSLTTGR
jgi:epsilon-lactone hydrolase